MCECNCYCEVCRKRMMEEHLNSVGGVRLPYPFEVVVVLLDEAEADDLRTEQNKGTFITVLGRKDKIASSSNVGYVFKVLCFEGPFIVVENICNKTGGKENGRVSLDTRTYETRWISQAYVDALMGE